MEFCPQLPNGNQSLLSLAYIWLTIDSWRMLLRHLTRSDCSRALLKAGTRIEISSAMMPMTTSSSTSVNPAMRGRCGRDVMDVSPEKWACRQPYGPTTRAAVRRNPLRVAGSPSSRVYQISGCACERIHRIRPHPARAVEDRRHAL